MSTLVLLPRHELEHEDGFKGTPGFQRCLLVGLVVDNFFHFFIKEQMKEIEWCFPFILVTTPETGTGLVKQPCTCVMFMFIEVCGCCYGGDAVKPLQVRSLVSTYSTSLAFLTFMTRRGHLTGFLWPTVSDFRPTVGQCRHCPQLINKYPSNSSELLLAIPSIYSKKYSGSGGSLLDKFAFFTITKHTRVAAHMCAVAQTQ